MEDKVTITLSASQRDLLLKYESSFENQELFQLISGAIKKGDNYEIDLDGETLEELVDQAAKIHNDYVEDDLEFESIDSIGEYLENVYDDHFSEIDSYSNYSSNTGAEYILKVSLEASSEIWRKIAIRDGQTINDLHHIIFQAFERYEDHMYAFIFSPTRRKVKNPRRLYRSSVKYTHPYLFEDQDVFDINMHNAAATTLASLGLKKGNVFYYLFDFGDEWWHEIKVEKTGGQADEGEYPRIIEREGKSPGQYPAPEKE
ncbi:MAG: plasmid pRiA4b ORF-3 family protein [Phycisphaerae bacterium]|nr:plasmid pRiA4b ORF-3 family protein [Phycisphaerae bacterium]